MVFRQAHLSVLGIAYPLYVDASNAHADFFVDFKSIPCHGGMRFTAFIHPKADLVLDSLELEFFFPALKDGAQFLANGYQSWSETRTFPLNAQIPGMHPLARPLMGLYGDEWVDDVPKGPGQLHSWTFGQWHDQQQTYLAGSLDERTGLTLVVSDLSRHLVRIKKDLRGLELGHSLPLLDIWVARGQVADLWARYAAAYAHKRPLDHTGRLGWTSWYRYFNRISEAQMTADLEDIAGSALPFHYVQVDDGWQAATGDWLGSGTSFPSGMGRMADAIRSHNMVPGIWLAPFVVSGRSSCFRKHPDWCLKDRHNRPLRAGWNPYWGGWYYALDLYHHGVRDYLCGVFHRLSEQYGYSLFKVDFLFAAALRPPLDKTRGQVMHDAVGLLRSLMGEQATMLACGLPLGSAMGQADICRIGGDVHMRWEHTLLRTLRFRERVSTLASLRSTLNRWSLDRRFFRSDPDVFILRKQQQHLSAAQQHTLLTVNALLGGVLFTSDNPAAYDAGQRQQVFHALKLLECLPLSVEERVRDVFLIRFLSPASGTTGSGAGHAWVNLTGRAQQVQHGPPLEPYQTRVEPPSGFIVNSM